MDKTLHIICHDVPWPADYGGVVDLFLCGVLDVDFGLDLVGGHVDVHCVVLVLDMSDCVVVRCQDFRVVVYVGFAGLFVHFLLGFDL